MGAGGNDLVYLDHFSFKMTRMDGKSISPSERLRGLRGSLEVPVDRIKKLFAYITQTYCYERHEYKRRRTACKSG